VEPPDIATVAIAFSIDSRVMIRLGRRSSSKTFMTSSPACSATVLRSSATAGTMPEPIGAIPRTSKAQAIVLAVNWPPQAPGPGLATFSNSSSSSSDMSPLAWAPTASNTSWIVTSSPL
jgi:hypothetical protein